MKKILTLIAGAVISFTLCLMLVGCSGGECEHRYGEWQIQSEVSCITDGYRSRVCELCGRFEESVEDATGHVGELLCEICGNPAVTPEQLFPALSLSNKHKITISDLTLEQVGDGFDKNIITLTLGEMYLSSEHSSLTGYAHGAIRVENLLSGKLTEREITAIISGEHIFLRDEGAFGNSSTRGEAYFARIALSEIFPKEISEYITDLEAARKMAKDLEEWYVKSLKPIFSEVAFEIYSSDIENAVFDLFSKLLTVKKESNGGKTVSVSLAPLEKLHNQLKANKVSQLIDEIWGEGSYSELLVSIPKLLDYSIGDLKEYLSITHGIDLERLLFALDELTEIFTDGELDSLEELIGFSADLSKYLTDRNLLNTRVVDIIIQNTAIANEATALNLVTDYAERLSTVTVYDLLLPEEYTTDDIDSVLADLSSGYSASVTLDSNGKYVKNVTEITLPYYLGGDYVSVIKATTDGDSTEVELRGNYLTSTLTLSQPEGLPVTEAKLNEIRAELGKIPKLTADSFAEIGFSVTSDEDGEVSEVYRYQLGEERKESAADLDAEQIYLIDKIKTVYFTETPLTAYTRQGCGSLIEVTLLYPTLTERKSYRFVNSYSEDGTLISTTRDETLASDDYYAVLTDEGVAEIRFLYDTEDGTVFSATENIGHSYTLLSSTEANTLCAQVYTERYACAQCSHTLERHYVKEHALSDKTATSTFEGGFVYGKQCTACGDTAPERTLYTDTDVTLTHYPSEDYAFSFSFAPEEGAKSYKIQISADGFTEVLVYAVTDEGLTRVKYHLTSLTLTVDSEVTEYVVMTHIAASEGTLRITELTD